MENFEFRYASSKSSIAVDSQIMSYKVAMQKGVIEIPKIQYFRIFESADYNLFVLTYKNEGGKIKKLHLFADPSEDGIKALLGYFSQLIPESDLSAKTADEARKLLGIGNIAKNGVIFAGLMVLVVTFLALWSVYKNAGLNIPSWLMITIFVIVILIVVIAIGLTLITTKAKSKDF